MVIDIENGEDVAPTVEHHGTVPVWWMVRPEELEKETRGGHLEPVSEFEVAGGLIHLHSLRTHEPSYVLRGRDIMTIESEDHRIAQGDLVDIPPDAVYSLRPISDNASNHWLCFAIAMPGSGPLDHTNH